jgi:Tol biopolymer transport system component
MSERSGTDEIWICDSDGSKTMQLTSFGGAAISGPSWSPDGQKVALTVEQKGMKEDICCQRERGCSPAHDDRSRGRQVASLVAGWKVDLLQLNPQRSGGNLEDAL